MNLFVPSLVGAIDMAKKKLLTIDLKSSNKNNYLNEYPLFSNK
jgi:hypothetical protein